jgi:hypothetical protein
LKYIDFSPVGKNKKTTDKTALTGQANPSQAKTSHWLVLTCSRLRFYHSELEEYSERF